MKKRIRDFLKTCRACQTRLWSIVWVLSWNHELNIELHVIHWKSQEIATKIFEKYNLVKPDGSVDLTAASKFLKDQVKDSEWLNIFQAGLKVCNKYSIDNSDSSQKVMKFTKDQCNMMYAIIMNCMDVYGFAVSLEYF